MESINYQSLKKLAKELKTSVKNLIALAPSNDPFYCGSPSQVQQAEWFAAQYKTGGFTNGVHLRRIHYWIVSQKEPVFMRDGMAYENTMRCWKELCSASKAARYLDLVPASAFDDRRNPPPVIFEPEPPEGLNRFYRLTTDRINIHEKYDDTMPSLPDTWVSRPDAVQRYSVEIWCEKSTMNDVLLPICRRHGLNLVTGLGELSISAVDILFDRIHKTGKPTRVLYIADYDPGGLSMPVAVSRKAEFMAQTSDVDLIVNSICLTRAQVEEYGLPGIMIKDSERRKAAFQRNHGESATELDALESLHPGELARIVVDAVLKYRDQGLRQRINAIYRKAQDQAKKDRDQVYEKYSEEIEAAKRDWFQARRGIRKLLSEWEERYKDLWSAMGDEMRGGFYQDCPKAEVAEEDGNALYDSSRDYFEQLAAYRKFQGKEDSTNA